MTCSLSITKYPPVDGYVFTSPEGALLRRHNFRKRFFLTAVRASMGEPVRFHDLRHTHVAVLIAQGEHPKVIQTRLGHSSIKVTLDRYVLVASNDAPQGTSAYIDVMASATWGSSSGGWHGRDNEYVFTAFQGLVHSRAGRYHMKQPFELTGEYSYVSVPGYTLRERNTTGTSTSWYGQSGDLRHPLHPGRSNGTGDRCRCTRPAQRRGPGRNRIDSGGSSGCTGHLWGVHIKCRHAKWRPGIRNSRIHTDRDDHRTVNPSLPGSLSLLWCQLG